MTSKNELEKIQEEILAQLPPGAFPVVDRPSLVDRMKMYETTTMKIDEQEMSLQDACELCDDDCYPLSCNDDLAKAIAEGYIKNKKTNN